MPETIRSLLFWLFMFLRIGSVATRPGRSPALIKFEFDSLPFVVPSLSEALQPYSAVIVTGGSSGIGKSFIQLGSKLKPDLIFCNLSRRPPPENIFPNGGKRLNHFSCDLSQPDQIERVATMLTNLLSSDVPTGRVLLINNSGFGAFGAVAELELRSQLQMIDVNVRALVHLTARLLPLLQTRGGTIMNIASTVAFQPTPFSSTYGASKAFVLHWSLALNEELRHTRVRVIAVCPGTTATDFFRRAGVQDAAMRESSAMSAEAVVNCAFKALARRRSLIVPGWRNKAYSFLGARVSKSLSARVAAKILSRRSHRIP